MPRLFVQRGRPVDLSPPPGRTCAQETAIKTADNSSHPRAMCEFMRFNGMLPESIRVSHLKTAEILWKNASDVRAVACCRQKA
jgi:hypothetical protein